MAFSLFGGKATWDRAGKTPAAGSINQDKYTVNTANNRFTELVYDAAGNVTKDKVIGTGRMEYKYDAENHVIAAGNNFVTNNTAPTSQYFYDASGKRTRKIVSGVETWFVYGMDGELVAEYNANAAVASPQKEYGYRGGQLLVVWDTNEPDGRKLQWLVADHLGTPRMTIDLSGRLADDPATTTVKEGVKRHDYLPFGEEIGAGVGIRSTGNGYTADQIKQKFTGYERDIETGLDYAQARYYANVQGRFTSVDPLISSAKTSTPQSWNRYTYTLNNPLVYIDKNGMWPTWIHNKMIDNYFRNRSEGDKKNIKAGSEWADFAKDPNYKPQEVGFSFAHAMRAPGQTPEDAAKTAGKYLAELKDMIKNSTSSEGKMTLLGIAAHVVMDNTSPEHEGFKQWDGAKLGNLYGAIHGAGELDDQFGLYRQGMANGALETLNQEMLGTSAYATDYQASGLGEVRDPVLMEIKKQFPSESASDRAQRTSSTKLYLDGVSEGRLRTQRLLNGQP